MNTNEKSIQKPIPLSNRRRYCHISKDYNLYHIKKTGYYCQLKHRSYQWPARINNNNTLISDSICKYSNKLYDTFVQAFPGATINSIIQKVQLGKIIVEKYNIIVLHVGTNNLMQQKPEEIIDQMNNLIITIRRKNNNAAIVLSQIIHRPCDSEYSEESRILVNKALQKLARKNRPKCFIWCTWRVTENKDKSVNLNLFARDHLHLNYLGNKKLRNFIEHNIITLKGHLKHN